MTNWKNYFKKHLNRETRKQLVKAVHYCVGKHKALDLGSGTFIESKFLLSSGFNTVVAIDNSKESKELAASFSDRKLNFKNISFQEYDFPLNTFDLINAQFSLPFYGKEKFKIFIKKVITSLKSNGIFVGQFFGNKDSWNTSESHLIFHTKEEVLSLLSGFEILEFTEEEKEGLTADQNLKHWHIFHFIAKVK